MWGFFDGKSGFGLVFVLLCIGRGGYKGEGWDCYIYFFEKMGEKKLGVESVLFYLLVVFVLFLVFVGIC